jgi:hypothetical protein
MKLFILFAIVFTIWISGTDADTKKEASKKQLQIGIKKKIENCSMKSRKGDSLSM